jgi:murein tripeptide amidase MpaA
LTSLHIIPEEKEAPEECTDPEALKGNCHLLIQGHPPPDHSPFATLSKKPKWPEGLWKQGTQIYDVLDPSKCLPPPESRSDRALRFDSHFESGNLARVFQLASDSYHCILEYDPNSSGSCQWFYFRLSNTRRDAKYRFYISGFHKHKSLYHSGARVFWYSATQAARSGLSWSRGGTKYAYSITRRFRSKSKRSTVQFQIRFPFDNDDVCLCYALPYTYSDLLRSIGNWQRLARPGFFKVEKLCDSEGGREVPSLTITAPTSPLPAEDRAIVFVTGRIHPGESNGSFLVHGLIDFLLSDDPLAQYILEHTIVKCVPMINIDGVIAGYYRISLHKFDLNRMWTAPDKILQPVVYETKRLIGELAASRKVACYIDFHGHSRLHGTFAYGCPNDDDPELRDDEKTFPRVLAFLSDAFAWNHCVFSFPKERKAASRIVVRTEFNVVNSFTIESSFGGIAAGPRAGLLYDEPLWKELGEKCGVGIYHLLRQDESPLISYVEHELSFLSPRPLPLSSDDPPQVPVKFSEELLSERPSARRGKIGQNMFFMKRPNSFLACDASGIATESSGVISPQWAQLQFLLG